MLALGQALAVRNPLRDSARCLPRGRRLRELPDCIDDPVPDRAGGITSDREFEGGDPRARARARAMELRRFEQPKMS
jgi:hypothetical protein